MKMLISEFKNLIPPLTEDEYKGLEASILEEGCRDALILWGDTLVDGHNRYEICTKHDIAFNAVHMDFDSRDDAMLWMIDNQRGRRNINPVDGILLGQKKAEILKCRAKAKQAEYYGNQYDKRTSVQMDKSPKDTISIRDEIAKVAGVSSGTVARFEQIQKHKPELIDDIRKGEVSIYQAYKAVKKEDIVFIIYLHFFDI